MGEKIKVIGNVLNSLEIELNEASVQGGDRWIHLQNEKFRLAISEKEYIMMAAAVIKAGKRFEEMKGTNK